MKGIGRGILDPGKLPQPSDKDLFIPFLSPNDLRVLISRTYIRKIRSFFPNVSNPISQYEL